MRELKPLKRNHAGKVTSGTRSCAIGCYVSGGLDYEGSMDFSYFICFITGSRYHLLLLWSQAVHLFLWL